MTKAKRVYKARLCGRGGELDMISADDLDTLVRQLGKRLVNKDWLLAPGDTIHIDGNED